MLRHINKRYKIYGNINIPLFWSVEIQKTINRPDFFM